MLTSLIIFGIPIPLIQTCKLLKQNTIEVREIRLLLKYWVVYSLLISFIHIFGFLISWIPFINEFIFMFVILLQSKEQLHIRLFDSYIQNTFNKYESQLDDFKTNIFVYINRLFSLLISLMLSKTKPGEIN